MPVDPARLRTVPLFEGIDDADVAMIAEHMEARLVSPGERLTREGASGYFSSSSSPRPHDCRCVVRRRLRQVRARLARAPRADHPGDGRPHDGRLVAAPTRRVTFAG